MLKPHVILSFADMLLCLFLVFLALFMAAKMEDQTQKALADPSLFLIELTWSKDSASDVDLFVKGADGQVISFKRQESTIGSLDADDKGLKRVDVARREVISIKTLMPGRYTVNVLLYKNGDGHYVVAQGRATKMQPFSAICGKEVQLITNGQEQTICSFDVDMNGDVVLVDNDTQYGIAKEG